MVQFRKLLFYVFLCAYLVCCPLTIMYAFGLVLAPRSQDRTLVRTGLIAVSTIPEDAQVYLGKSRFHDTSPTVISDLLPGTYTLSLKHEGTLPWTREVTIEEGKALALKDVWLKPLHLESTHRFAADAEALYAVDRWLLIASGKRLEDFSAYPPDLETSFTLSRFLGPALEKSAKVRNLWLSEHASGLVMELDFDWKLHYIYVDLKGRDPRIREISPLVMQSADNILFDPRNDSILWIRHKDGIDRVDLEANTLTRNVANDVIGWGLDDEKLVLMTGDGSLWETNHQGQQLKLLQDYTVPAELAKAKSVDLILVDSQLLFLDNEGRLFASGFEQPLADEIRSWRLLTETNRLLLTRKSSIGTLRIQSWDQANAPRPQVRWIYKHPRAVTHVTPIEKDRYFLFSDEKMLYLLQLWQTALTEAVPLQAIEPDTRFAYQESEHRLLYIDPQHYLTQLNIIPKNTILTFIQEEEASIGRNKQQ